MYHDSSLACIPVLAKWLSDTASYLKPILNTFFKLEIRFRYINQNFYNHFISTFCGFQDRIFINIKLPGPIFYQILCMYLNDDFAKNVYTKRHCSFPGQLSQLFHWENDVHSLFTKQTWHKRYQIISTYHNLINVEVGLIELRLWYP